MNAAGSPLERRNVKTGTTEHIKMKRLKRALGIPLWQAVGILESLWHLTGRCAWEGDIGKLGDSDIAEYLEYSGDPEALVNALCVSGWIDSDPQCRYRVHDWYDHAPEYVRKRLSRNGLGKSDQPSTHAQCPDKSGHVQTSRDLGALTYPNQAKPNPTKPDLSLCTEPPKPAASVPPSPVVMVFPTVGKAKEWGLAEAKIAEYRESYPAVDVPSELRKALQWCRDNPRNRKTPDGMPKFLSGWLSRVQNSARPVGGSQKATGTDLAANILKNLGGRQ